MIGQRCRNVKAVDAADVVAGYLVVNDVSVRDWQRATPTMTMGKSWDTHGPIGPWLVTTDEIPDPHDLQIRTWVDDDLRQDASTAQMITQLLGADRPPVDGVHVAAGHDHRHGHAGRRRVRDGPTALPVARVRSCASRSTSIGTIENPVIAQP